MHLSRSANVLAALLIVGCQQVLAKDDATVAWLRDGRVEVRALAGPVSGKAASSVSSDAAAMKVPLGSLWKLFVYAHLAETNAKESAYVCTAKSGPANEEERYCCEPGESIDRDQALSRSCAPYFSAQRLGISDAVWQSRWRERSKAAWLLDIKRLQPETKVPLAELLDALNKLPPSVRTEARRAMLETSIKGYGRESWTVLGTGIRYKTYSWHRADGTAFGGAAGWLSDGTPFWFGATGSSRTALNAWASKLAEKLPEPRWQNTSSAVADVSCVDVEFFKRYAIEEILPADGKGSVQPGELRGNYRIRFANGNWLSFSARGDMTLQGGEVPNIVGRFSINDYVARVIDREGSGEPQQAARALAIAARSYLVQNARFEAGCWRIADSTRTQRVSANPPSKPALAAAWFTDEIVLSGAPVQYHHDAEGKNRMAWKSAVARAGEGWDFERILTQAYPQAALAGLNGREECTRLAAAETWLSQASQSWQRRLQREPGYEALNVPPRICALSDGNPYADQRRLRIYVRGWRSLNERITLAHEYLHLVFRFHPNGADEEYVERMARRLIEG